MATLPDRLENGALPAFAFPGGYQVVYYTADGGTLCPDCANGGNGSMAATTLDPECPNDTQWLIVTGDIYYEGPPLRCDHCNTPINSAYGNPDDAEETNR